ncbi:hypothetical protein QAD02_002054 [Eretmocerus hayati]|uniref:Uncharacterized protein n=1 Tax=Eretmocerus hayati TaxID=131215 RepID=A0ACC2NHU6_9HYME|nr:hypothetical protein QAD02_002054 [Eretmocerus hayati]
MLGFQKVTSNNENSDDDRTLVDHVRKISVGMNLGNGNVNGYQSDSCERFEKMSDETLISACETNNISFINKLLDAGYNPNKSLSSGWTLLLYAASNAKPKLVQHLLDKGADPNAHHEGYTALLALCNSTKGSAHERFICLTNLINSKANVDATNKVKETPLMYACKMQDTNFILELLRHVHDVNFADGEGRTALFYAVTDNRYDVVKLLIDHGADLKCTNYRGYTAEDVAVTKGFEDLLPLLELPVDDVEEYIDTDHIVSWMDMFPSLCQADKNNLNNDISNLLYGMGLESYKSCFCGINLKKFLRLTEKELEAQGIDISVHRTRFFNELLRFYAHEWGSVPIKPDGNLFDLVKIVGNMNTQLIVISSSICTLKNIIDSSICQENREEFEAEIKKMQQHLMIMKNGMKPLQATARKIQNENSDLSIPIHIRSSSKSSKRWVLLTVLTIASIYFLKTVKIKKLLVNENIGLRNWRNTTIFIYDKSIEKLNLMSKILHL